MLVKIFTAWTSIIMLLRIYFAQNMKYLQLGLKCCVNLTEYASFL